MRLEPDPMRALFDPEHRLFQKDAQGQTQVGAF
jgi:hypothetical protein